MTIMMTIALDVVILPLVLAVDTTPPSWREILTLALPEIVEHYDLPIRIDPTVAETGVDSAAPPRELTPDELRQRRISLEAMGLEEADRVAIGICRAHLSLPPGMRGIRGDSECAETDLSGTVFAFSDPIRVEEGWRVRVSISSPDFFGDASLVLVPSGDGAWLAKYRRGPIINYF